MVDCYANNTILNNELKKIKYLNNNHFNENCIQKVNDFNENYNYFEQKYIQPMIYKLIKLQYELVNMCIMYINQLQQKKDNDNNTIRLAKIAAIINYPNNKLSVVTDLSTITIADANTNINKFKEVLFTYRTDLLTYITDYEKGKLLKNIKGLIDFDDIKKIYNILLINNYDIITDPTNLNKQINIDENILYNKLFNMYKNYKLFYNLIYDVSTTSDKKYNIGEFHKEFNFDDFDSNSSRQYNTNYLDIEFNDNNVKSIDVTYNKNIVTSINKIDDINNNYIEYINKAHEVINTLKQLYKLINKDILKKLLITTQLNTISFNNITISDRTPDNINIIDIKTDVIDDVIQFIQSKDELKPNVDQPYIIFITNLCKLSKLLKYYFNNNKLIVPPQNKQYIAIFDKTPSATPAAAFPCIIYNFTDDISNNYSPLQTLYTTSINLINTYHTIAEKNNQYLFYVYSDQSTVLNQLINFHINLIQSINNLSWYDPIVYNSINSFLVKENTVPTIEKLLENQQLKEDIIYQLGIMYRNKINNTTTENEKTRLYADFIYIIQREIKLTEDEIKKMDKDILNMILFYEYINNNMYNGQVIDILNKKLPEIKNQYPSGWAYINNIQTKLNSFLTTGGCIIKPNEPNTLKVSANRPSLTSSPQSSLNLKSLSNSISNIQQNNQTISQNTKEFDNYFDGILNDIMNKSQLGGADPDPKEVVNQIKIANRNIMDKIIEFIKKEFKDLSEAEIKTYAQQYKKVLNAYFKDKYGKFEENKKPTYDEILQYLQYLDKELTNAKIKKLYKDTEIQDKLAQIKENWYVHKKHFKKRFHKKQHKTEDLLNNSSSDYSSDSDTDSLNDIMNKSESSNNESIKINKKTKDESSTSLSGDIVNKDIIEDKDTFDNTSTMIESITGGKKNHYNLFNY